eukprot:COSAG05_NODE_4304_length_1574_cov_16.284746_1_plen_91_part_00
MQYTIDSECVCGILVERSKYPYSAETARGGDGNQISCASGREEPRLLLDPISGQPIVLSTLCKKGGGPMAGTEWTRVLLQRARLKIDDCA